MTRHSGAAGGLYQAQKNPAADRGSGICSQAVEAGRAKKDMAGGLTLGTAEDLFRIARRSRHQTEQTSSFV